MACLEIHRERLALTNSMRDIDSAVGRYVALPHSAATPQCVLIPAISQSRLNHHVAVVCRERDHHRGPPGRVVPDDDCWVRGRSA